MHQFCTVLMSSCIKSYLIITFSVVLLIFVQYRKCYHHYTCYPILTNFILVICEYALCLRRKRRLF